MTMQKNSSGLILKHDSGILMSECCCYPPSVCFDVDYNRTNDFIRGCSCHAIEGSSVQMRQFGLIPRSTLPYVSADSTYFYYGSRSAGTGVQIGNTVWREWENETDCTGAYTDTSFVLYGHVALTRSTLKIHSAVISVRYQDGVDMFYEIDWHMNQAHPDYDFGDKISAFNCWTAYALDYLSPCFTSSFKRYDSMDGVVIVTEGPCPGGVASLIAPRLEFDEAIEMIASAEDIGEWSALKIHAGSVARAIDINAARKGECWTRRQKDGIIRMCRNLQKKDIISDGDTMIA